MASVKLLPGYLTTALQQKELIWQLLKREVHMRYKGTIFGLLWAILLPLIMLAVYTFAFSVVFQARWGTTNVPGEFAQFLFCGLIVYNLFSECVGRAAHLFVSQPNYVKKVVFPLELLTVVVLGGSIFNAVISFLVLLVFILVTHGSLPATAMLLPVVLIPLCAFILACALTIATLGVYVRDIGNVVTILLSMLMFLSPIFYPIHAVPEAFRVWLLFNPLSPVIEACRSVLLLGQAPNWSVLGAYMVAALILLHCACWFYGKARKGFADVL